MKALSVEATALPVRVEEVQDTLARNLSVARKALHMSQDQLAVTAGVSRATVNQLEGGSSAKCDPHLSTVVSLASALSLSPVFLFLGRDEIDAIADAPGSTKAKDVQAQLTNEELETMSRLLHSGIAKNKATAVEMGATAATTAGMSARALAATAIGTALMPGLGTAIGAVMGSRWLAKKIAEEKKKNQ